jgi:hypothetical protein
MLLNESGGAISLSDFASNVTMRSVWLGNKGTEIWDQVSGKSESKSVGSTEVISSPSRLSARHIPSWIREKGNMTECGPDMKFFWRSSVGLMDSFAYESRPQKGRVDLTFRGQTGFFLADSIMKHASLCVPL